MAAGIELYNDVLNQLGSPALYSDIFANRPPFGFTGRLFISTDTNEIYRDTGTSWVLISGGGSPVNIYNSDGSLTAARTMTMAGHNLTFEGGASPNRIIQSADNNVARIFSWRTAGVQRWAIRVDGNETGSNAGANFAVRAYNDAGTFIFAPLSISRSTGEIETFAEESITTGGQSIIGLYTNSTGTYASGLTTTGGNPQTSNFNIYTLATAGSVTFANSNLVGTTVNVLRAQVQNGGTITFPPGASGGLRAATNFVSQLQYNTQSAAATYTRMANVHLQGVYEVSGGNTFTITNAHQLLINSLNENAYTGAQLTITNRWGIYQDGASDGNYFAGVMQLGSTTSTGEKLQVTGTARVTQSAYLATASATDRVGIGTSNPLRKVTSEIAAANDFNYAATSANLGTIGNWVAYLYGFAGNTYQKCATFFESIDANARGKFHIALNDATTSANVTLADARLTVTSAGNVGIGTTSPQFRQQVLTTGSTAATIVSSFGIAGGSGGTGAAIAFTAEGDNTGTNKVGIGNVRIGGWDVSALAFYAVNSQTQGNFTSADERMRITSGGNVLIGTTTDGGQKLQNVGDTRLDGNVGIFQGTFGTSATRTLAISSGTAPASSPADCFQLYSADITAGNAAAHFRTENGAVVKIYQETTTVGTATFAQNVGTEVRDNSTFGTGANVYTIGQVVQALRNLGILA